MGACCHLSPVHGEVVGRSMIFVERTLFTSLMRGGLYSSLCLVPQHLLSRKHWFLRWAWASPPLTLVSPWLKSLLREGSFSSDRNWVLKNWRCGKSSLKWEFQTGQHHIMHPKNVKKKKDLSSRGGCVGRKKSRRCGMWEVCSLVQHIYWKKIREKDKKTFELGPELSYDLVLTMVP